ncbi:hypothetical protein B0O80DRAFT_18914 [Mortierella sp. GBAus27b]|nr:hypothetical protein B0O80DRAFT_18914 [Mortierella sp. GBAus27b]
MATRTRQRTPLHQLSRTTPSPTNLHSPTTSSANTARRTPPLSGTGTVGRNAATSSSITTSSVRTRASASTARSTTSTVTPTTSSVSKDTSAMGGLFGSKSNNSSKNAGLGAKRPVSNKESSSTTKMGSKTDTKTSGAGNSKPFELPLLPVPALGDFELSMPFLNDPSSSATSSTPPSSSRTPSSSLSNTRTLNTGSMSRSTSRTSPRSTPSPSTGRFLTSQSSRVQNLNPRATLRSNPTASNNNTLSKGSSVKRQSVMSSKVTTIDATGVVHQQSPLDLSLLEVSDYFIHSNNEDLTAEKPSPNHSRSSNLEQKALPAEPSSSEYPSRSQRGTPSLSASKHSSISGPSSPSPSVTTPSLISDKGSLRSSLQAQSLHHHQGNAIDRAPLQQQQVGQKSDASRSERSAGHAPRVPSKDDNPPQLASSGSASRAKAPATKTPTIVTSPVTPTPKKAVAPKQPSSGSIQDSPQSPNLRSRITRLFRPTPKLERPSPQEQRLHQRQRPSNHATVSSASRSSPRQRSGANTPPSPQPLTTSLTLPSLPLSLPLLMDDEPTQTETPLVPSAKGQSLPQKGGGVNR